MPIYEYECSSCGCFEHSQSMHDAPLARCPKCRRKVQRLISASSFHLKGGGWYSDGYAKKSETKSKEGAGETKSTESTESTSSEAKSETTTAEPKTSESKDSKSTSPPAASTKPKPKRSARSTADASSD